MILPDEPACIYALVFASGVVKVGKSQSRDHLVWRLRSHKAMGKIFGDDLILESVIDVDPNEVLRRERLFMGMCDMESERNSESTSCEWFRFSDGAKASSFIESAMVQLPLMELPTKGNLAEVIREKKKMFDSAKAQGIHQSTLSRNKEYQAIVDSRRKETSVK